MPADLKLVHDSERPIVHCPDGMREDHRRALLAKLHDLEMEISNCVRRALEGSFVITAARVECLREPCREAIAGLGRER